MKKTMLVLLSVLLVVASVLTLTACGKKDCDKLGHDWGDWSVQTEATCTEDGVKVRTCNRCQEEDTASIDALGHDWGEPVVVPATCGVAGTSTKTCSRCDAEDVTDIPATENHTWVADAESNKNKEATCTEKGVEAQKCSVCGATREVATDMIAHDLGELVPAEAPDCGHDGTVAYKVCSMCEQYFDEEGNLLGDSEEDLVDPATGDHQWEEDALSEENVEPTCGEPGVKAYKCSVCDETKTEVVEPTGEHQWEDDNDPERADDKVEPSCAPGVQPTKCNVCGALSTRVDPATGAHSFSSDAMEAEIPETCDTDGRKAYKVCENCGLYCDENGNTIGEGKEEDLVIPAGHKPDGSIVQGQDATCTDDGSKTHQQCSVCQKYLDENGDVIGEGTADDLVIPSRGGHVLDYENATWNWPNAESGLNLENGITVTVPCENCEQTFEKNATVVKDEEGSSEATVDAPGAHIYVATLEDDLGITDSKTYTIAQIPKDTRTYFFAGAGSGSIDSWDYKASNAFTRIEGTNTFVLENYTLLTGDEMKLRFNTSAWDNGSGTQYGYGAYFLYNATNSPFASSSEWDGNGKIAEGKSGIYNITLTTQGALTPTTGRNSGQIVELKFELVQSLEVVQTDLGWYLTGGMTGWAQAPTDWKLEQEGSNWTGTFTFESSYEVKAIHVTETKSGNNTSYTVEWSNDPNLAVTAGTWKFTLNPSTKVLSKAAAEATASALVAVVPVKFELAA